VGWEGKKGREMGSRAWRHLAVSATEATLKTADCAHVEHGAGALSVGLPLSWLVWFALSVPVQYR
jgi:hypothetical protein